MTLLTIFWTLIGISFVVLAITGFGIKKDLLTPIFWILFGVSLMILAVILWHAIRGS
tara:strand:- start:174 stop:344 length:171 start_codon:yes stop_codon:yes gene_type:complete